MDKSDFSGKKSVEQLAQEAYTPGRAERVLEAIGDADCSLVGQSSTIFAIAGGELSSWTIEIVGLKNSRRVLPIGETTIGRGDGVSIQLAKSGQVSRLHARLNTHADGRLTVRDLDSLNGIKINGEVVPREQALELRSGDVLGVGEVSFLFTLVPAV